MKAYENFNNAKEYCDVPEQGLYTEDDLNRTVTATLNGLLEDIEQYKDSDMAKYITGDVFALTMIQTLLDNINKHD